LIADSAPDQSMKYKVPALAGTRSRWAARKV